MYQIVFIEIPTKHLIYDNLSLSDLFFRGLYNIWHQGQQIGMP